MNRPIPPPPGHVYDGATPALGLDITVLLASVPELPEDDLARAAATACQHAIGNDQSARRADALDLLDHLGLRDFALARIARDER